MMKYTTLMMMVLSTILSTPVHNSPDIASKESEQVNEKSQVIVLNFINNSAKNSTSESISPIDTSSSNVMDKQSISSVVEKKLQSVDANVNPSQQPENNNQDLVNMTSQTSSMAIAKSSDSQGNIVNEQSSNQINTNTDVSNKVYKFSTPYMNLNVKFDAKNNRGIIVVQPNTASPDNNVQKPAEENDNPMPAENANQPPKENENLSEDNNVQAPQQQTNLENLNAQASQQQSTIEDINAQASSKQSNPQIPNLQSLPQQPNVENLNPQSSAQQPTPETQNLQSLSQQSTLENLNSQTSPQAITESKGSGNGVGSSKGSNSSLYSGNGYNAISGPSGTIIYSTNYGSTLGEASFNSNTNAAAHSNFNN